MALGERRISDSHLGISENNWYRPGWDDRGGGRRDFHLPKSTGLGKVSFRAKLMVWLATALLIGPLVFWSLDARPPIEVIKATVVPDGGSVGSRVTAYYEVVVKRDHFECNLDVERQWIDSKGFVWPNPTAHLAYSGGPQIIRLTMAIPMDAFPGRSNISNVLIWQCNPWQKIWPRRQALPPLNVEVTK